MKKVFFAIGVFLCSVIGGAYGQTFINFVNAAAITILPSYMSPGNNVTWSGITATNPQNWNFSDRWFNGNAAYNVPDSRSNTNTTYIPSATQGANWIVRDSQALTMAVSGNIALAGISESKDGDSIASAPAATGVAGAAICNSSLSRGCWASYFDVQFESGSRGFGVEYAIKNKGANVATDPYTTPTGATFGAQFSGGGDNSYGGSAANPSDTGIIFTQNSQTWNTGILFKSNSLTNGRAIAMGQSHHIDWFSGSGTVSASLMSGSGSPAGTVSCTARCLYLRTDGGAGSTLYVNETGGGTSGWAAK